MADERVEYRVTAMDIEDGNPFEWTDYEGENLGHARASYTDLANDEIPFDRVLLQRRTITTSAWRSLRRADSAALPRELRDPDA